MRSKVLKRLFQRSSTLTSDNDRVKEEARRRQAALVERMKMIETEVRADTARRQRLGHNGAR